MAPRREQAPPTDPGVKVPRAVREGAERAEAAQRASLGIAEPLVLPPEEPPAVPPAFPPPATSGEPPPAANALPPPNEVVSPQEPPSEPPDDPNGRTWEERYKTINGRYEADRKRSREQVDQLINRVQQLEQQLTTSAPVPVKLATKLNVSPDEVSDYGEDFIGLVQRIAQHTVEGTIQPIQNELGQTRAQVGVQKNASMHQQMDGLFPDWRKLNSDQRFIDWVMLPDAYSGAMRQKLMQEAWDNGDARRVNAFFQGFLAEEAALTPAGGGSPAARAPAAPNGIGAPAPTPQIALASLAAPGGARSASQSPAEKPTYTTEDITRFYTEVAAGRWRHRETERIAIDADIMRAQHEGRILTNRRYEPPSAPPGFTR
jgi:hypothetical protein